MKNVLVHVNPSKTFTSRFPKEKDVLARIQIDNSLDLGWRIDDILLYTNFPYEYRGVRSIIVPDELYCPFRPLSTKTITVAHVISDFDPSEIYWVHDFDAFQLEPLDVSVPVAGFTDYGWSKKWCLGSYFVRSPALGLLQTLRDAIYKTKEEDERALTRLTRERPIALTKLNITYNFGMRHIGINHAMADKPLRVVHFHPFYKDTKLPDTTLNMFMYGKNEIGVPLLTKRLTKIFQKHGIK